MVPCKEILLVSVHERICERIQISCAVSWNFSRLKLALYALDVVLSRFMDMTISNVHWFLGIEIPHLKILIAPPEKKNI